MIYIFWWRSPKFRYFYFETLVLFCFGLENIMRINSLFILQPVYFSIRFFSTHFSNLDLKVFSRRIWIRHAPGKKSRLNLASLRFFPLDLGKRLARINATKKKSRPTLARPWVLLLLLLLKVVGRQQTASWLLTKKIYSALLCSSKKILNDNLCMPPFFSFNPRSS